jgi:hypothetical protein
MTTRTSYFMRPLALVMWTVLAASVMMVVLASPAQAANITVNSLPMMPMGPTESAPLGRP